MNEKLRAEVRTVALVGPYASGKTTLLESLVYSCGGVSRKGNVKDRNTLGDSSPEARERGMSVELNAAFIETEGLRINLLDCPGFVEFAAESYPVLLGVDAAIVVCDARDGHVPALAALFKFLDDNAIPHFIFLNKMEEVGADVQATLSALRAFSRKPLVLQQMPIGQGELFRGLKDLITENVVLFESSSRKASAGEQEVQIQAEESAARAGLLETLADGNDALLGELLQDIVPSHEEILSSLRTDVGSDRIVPVLVGSSEKDFGVRELLGVLLRELPDPDATAKRHGLLGSVPAGTVVVQVLKNFFNPQGGKLSLVKVWCGSFSDGVVFGKLRVSGLFRLQGQALQGVAQVHSGDVIVLGRLEGVRTGEILVSSPASAARALTPADVEKFLPVAKPPAPVFGYAISAERQSDEVKLSACLSKLQEEDPTLVWERQESTRELLIWGQGQVHLQTNLERLKRKYNLPVSKRTPRIPYKETITKVASNIHGRYKHQTGGHGQFGDVYLDIRPQGRGEGIAFAENIVGGSVPRQYIPGVEMGVRESLEQGPLGFPVVDLSVVLINGSFHAVDSSEQAFKLAARHAMQEGLARCGSVLLEPMMALTISTPSEFTSKVMQLVSGHRGQILGYDSKGGWPEWDDVAVCMPQAEIHEISPELRSVSQGASFFESKPSHLQEVPDRVADRILATLGSGMRKHG